MKKVIKTSTIIAGLVVSMISGLYADDVTLPYTFTAGETAKASEVNANFETLKNGVNSKLNQSYAPKVVSVYAGGGGDFRTATRVLGTVMITAPVSGKIVVSFSGVVTPDDGDSIVISASHDEDWHVNDGIVHAAVAVYGITGGYAYPFNHTRIYEVEAGNHQYYATARNWVKKGGNGNASIDGILIATFYPNQN